MDSISDGVSVRVVLKELVCGSYGLVFMIVPTCSAVKGPSYFCRLYDLALKFLVVLDLVCLLREIYLLGRPLKDSGRRFTLFFSRLQSSLIIIIYVATKNGHRGACVTESALMWNQ